MAFSARIFILCISVFNVLTLTAQNFVRAKDAFGTRCFIENKGQYIHPIDAKKKVLYVYEHAGQKLFFTNEGFVIAQTNTAVPERNKENEYEFEKEQEREREAHKELKQKYIQMSWLNVSQRLSIEASEKVAHYFTFGGPELNAGAYKRLLYKNVVEGIDIEYTLPEDSASGIKYNIIVHEGANISDFKFRYKGTKSDVGIADNGDLLVPGPFGLIKELAPADIVQAGKNIGCKFSIDRQIISFETNQKISGEYTIDPWLVSINTTAVIIGFDIDLDNFGNSYVMAGGPGITSMLVEKFNSAGVLQWVFVCNLPLQNFFVGNGCSTGILCEKSSGKIYVSGAGFAGVIRLNQLGNYDNFVSSGGFTGYSNFESSDLTFMCNGNIMQFGGASASVRLLNVATGSFYAGSFLQTTFAAQNCCYDVIDFAQDMAGNIFYLHASVSAQTYVNKIVRVAPSYTTNIFNAASTYSSMNEMGNPTVGNTGQQGFNCLAVNSSYLYYYNGLDIQAISKTTGTAITSTQVSGHTIKQQSGIAADECNRIYVGGRGGIITYSFTGTSFVPTGTISLGPIANAPFVDDLLLDASNNILYASGLGYFASFSVPSASACASNLCPCFSPPVSVTTGTQNCPNIGTATVSLPSIAGGYTYTWLPGGQTSSVAVGLLPGTYTVLISPVNCIGSYSATTTFTSAAPAPSISSISNSITCATLGSATVSVNNLLPPLNYTWLPTAQTGSTASGLAPGNYTINISSSACQTTFTLPITFSSPILLTGSILNTSSVSCNAAATGTGLVTNLQGGSAVQNFLWTNGQQSYTTAFTNSLSAGVWSITVTDALTGCQIYQSFYVSQPPPLQTSLSISTSSICQGTSADIIASSSGGTPAYSYTFVNGPSNYSTTVTESVVGTHIYTVQNADANNCFSTASISLDVIPNPILVVPSITVCPSALAVITASGATSYTWMIAGNAASITSASFSDTPVATTQYTLLGSALGCSAAISPTVHTYASPVPTITTNSPRCVIDNALFAVAGGTAATWLGPNIFSSSLLTPSIAAVGPANAGVYSTTITSIDGCTATASASFVVNPSPTVSAAGSTVCTSQTLSLFANASSGCSFYWTGPAAFVSNAQNPNQAFPTLNANGIYTVKVTAPTSCTNTAIAQVSVVSPPILIHALTSNSFCAQGFNGSANSVTLSNSGANSYSLYASNLLGANAAIPNTAALFALAPYPTSITISSATIIGSNGICASNSTFTYAILPNPTVNVTVSSAAICAGENFTLSGAGASTYVWTGSNSNFSISANTSSIKANPPTTAVFSVYGSSLACNSPNISKTVTVNPMPAIAMSAASASICLFDKVNLHANGASTGTTFQWLPILGLSNYNLSSVVCNAQSSQVYTVIATANNCSTAVTTSVVVWPLPTAHIDKVSNVVCLGDSIYLSGSGGVIYTWLGPDNISLSGQSVRFKAWSPSTAGVYTLVVADKNNCKHSTNTNISVLSLPQGSLPNLNEEVCVPYCALHKFEGFNSKTIQSNWTINSTKFSGNEFYYCYKEAGTYTLSASLVDQSSGCKSSLNYLVIAHPKPLADFDFVPKHPIENEDEIFLTNTSSGEGTLSYQWHFNNNKSNIVSTKNTSVRYTEAGDYIVALLTKNNWNCVDTTVKSIHVEPDFAMYVPNTFTPNDDTRNDVFLASVRSSKLFDLKIYDRWGAELFHSKSPNDGWDGTFKGTACKQDTYTWVIELSTVGGQRVVRTGTVLLMR